MYRWKNETEGTQREKERERERGEYATNRIIKIPITKDLDVVLDRGDTQPH